MVEVTTTTLAICDLPDDLLLPILLAAASHELGRAYYTLSTVCRSFHRILANDALKLHILRRHRPSDLLFCLQSWAGGAPDLERLIVAHLTALPDSRDLAAVATRDPPSLLDFAVARGFVDLSRLLLKHGADGNRRRRRYPHWYDDEVWRAAKRNDLAMLRLLLVDLGAWNPFDEFETAHAVARSAAAQRLLLRAPTTGPRDPAEVLARGIELRDPEMVRLALAVGAAASVHDVVKQLAVLAKNDTSTDDEMGRLFACTGLLLDAGIDELQLLNGITEWAEENKFEQWWIEVDAEKAQASLPKLLEGLKEFFRARRRSRSPCKK
ncbi:hypothetical protein DFJ73DRAFT_858504 [Zopfochytrium polystomum]|nr:hypothetical protein DFJ73DRAFT_858504 [Zopfochytrium polystomum]